MTSQRLVLLKLEADNRNVFFVLRQPKYDHQESSGWTPDNDRYFYEEHSCPTNWFRDIVGVIESGDEDPHGFLKFVRAIDIPEGFNPDNPHQVSGENYGNTSIPAWSTIFPEIVNCGQVIDAEAVDISSALAYLEKPQRADGALE